MNSETIAKALGGRKAGGGWTARCPAHDDRTPSHSICDANDRKGLIRCHAGCDQEKVIGALRSRGLWTDSRRFTRLRSRSAAKRTEPDRNDTKRTETALAIWQATMPADGTLAEAYLLSRGLHLPPPATLRFHAELKHPSGGTRPAMVALVTRGSDDTPLAIHRTYLARAGSGKAPVARRK